MCDLIRYMVLNQAIYNTKWCWNKMTEKVRISWNNSTVNSEAWGVQREVRTVEEKQNPRVVYSQSFTNLSIYLGCFCILNVSQAVYTLVSRLKTILILVGGVLKKCILYYCEALNKFYQYVLIHHLDLCSALPVRETISRLSYCMQFFLFVLLCQVQQLVFQLRSTKSEGDIKKFI